MAVSAATINLRTYLSFEMNSSHVGEGQLFFNTGYGFNERQSHKFAIAKSDSWEQFYIPVPFSEVLNVRFDPSSEAGEYILRNVRLTDFKGRILSIYDFGSSCSE